MATLSVDQLITTAKAPLYKRVLVVDPTTGKSTADSGGAGGTPTGYVVVADFADPSQSQHVPWTQFDLRICRAAAIMLAESGGVTDAVNVNGAGSRAPGSRDRGLWQWNDKAWPQITDVAAFDPDIATEDAYKASKGYTDWTPWHGSHGLDPAGVDAKGHPTPMQQVVTAYEASTGHVIDKGLLGIPGEAAVENGVISGVKQLVDVSVGWAKNLGKLLAYITSSAFWKRFGIGALGLLLIIVAVVLVAVSSRL